MPDDSSPNDLGIGGVKWYSTIRRLGHMNNCRREELGTRLVSLYGVTVCMVSEYDRDKGGGKSVGEIHGR